MLIRSNVFKSNLKKITKKIIMKNKEKNVKILKVVEDTKKEVQL